MLTCSVWRGHALLETAARSFYAQQDARTPLYLAALNALVYIVLAINLSRLLAAPGIALANTFAFTLEALLLLFILSRRYPRALQVGGTLMRAAAAALLGGTVTYFVLQLPLPALLAPFVGMGLGGLAALPLILPEIRVLVKL
ncbi:MAG: polysaccharide biosynthesis C-terminal domain-containing protein [Anaerolineales bacterium]|nr:polysaccharide biosynthesis C-terminal domain-containing protein [Anaerolineales bacterium]